MKYCPKCQQEKSVDAFHGRGPKTKRLASWCKDCKNKSIRSKYTYERGRAKHLMRCYKITPEEYNHLFESQEGRCRGCGRHQSSLQKKLCVDHSHKTNKIRGLLCLDCNISLGHVKDDTQTLLSLVYYLTEFEE